jgi:protein gp37
MFDQGYEKLSGGRMGSETGIEWTEVTWNPTTGCDRISAGCDHCYALSLAKRLKAMGQAHCVMLRGPGDWAARPGYR